MLRVLVILAVLPVLTLFTVKCSYAQCHGGSTMGGHQHQQESNEDQTVSHPVKQETPVPKITVVQRPPTLTVEGQLQCPACLLLRKGADHGKEKCQNSTLQISKVLNCDKSGKPECSYEGKVYHILYNGNSKKIVNKEEYHNQKVKIEARLYPEERVIEIVKLVK